LISMRRRRDPELMDDPHGDPREHRAALAALRRSSRILGIDTRLAHAVAEVAPREDARIVELGTGGGGLLAAMAAHFNRMKTSHHLMGLDRSPFALAVAQSDLGAGQTCSFVAGDALRLPFADQSLDVVVCSLLFHHFDTESAIGLLREAARVACRAVVIGDLDRTRLAWLLTSLVTRLTSRSRLFHVDGPRSVRAAYRPDEVRALTAAAGLAVVSVRPSFPFRWIMTWRRNPS
jgi:2-polyprenyl-3-methyl-5-hydroxy-6-metoxy-1,4-benzoquinol methylase